MSFLADLVIDNLRKIKSAEYPIYSQIIRHCYETTPPFARDWFGRRYFELARNPEWFANSLVANSALEGYGSTQIWKFSNRVDNARYAEALRQHALDESRHSTMFIRMLRLTFPGIELDAKTEKSLDGLQPKYTRRVHPPIEKRPPDELILGREALNEIIQVHITEIRALILQFLLRPAMLAYAPESSTGVLTSASDVLIRDESRHIRYSAEFFEDAARAGERDFLFAAFEHQTRKFNDLTMEELERDQVEL
ncbi:MAG: hypothetical protein QOJ86_5033 [Bradyrhizobium sp.]|jgi:hypothetical protein|nr:hypothetical protein [Bradyrhizobium sp.]